MKENKQNKKKIIIYYLIAIVLYAVVAGLLFPTFSKTKEEEVPYNKFIEMLDKGEVKEVKILDTHINFKAKDKNNVIYKAGLIRDEKLVDRL